MECQFNKTALQCLRRVVAGVQTKEETQEVRLADSMPDIGKIIGCWGQTLIRSKEWRSDGMRVSGGVMAWVLYAPEDGSQPRSVECWLPFQVKWDSGETQRDGSICVQPLLLSTDARNISARKMIVRVCVGVSGEAMEPVEQDVYEAKELPEDVQLLINKYPLSIPVESGEKLLQQEEELELPGNLPAMSQILRYEITPRVMEQKVMANRLVFRGMSALRLLYSSEDGKICSWDTEIPFSQYTDLDRDYGANVEATVTPIVTSLEIDRDADSKLVLKCGIAAQYVLYDRVLLDIVEDAYSNVRKLEMAQQALCLPVCLESRNETREVSLSINASGQKILDVQYIHQHPEVMQTGDVAQVTIPIQAQILYLDPDGNLQNATGKTSLQWEIPSDPGNRLAVTAVPDKASLVQLMGDSMEAECTLQVECNVFAQQELHMVTALQLEEVTEPDPARPSLILRKSGGLKLWDLAKACKSTEGAIRTANQLEDEPAADRILLIPIP